MLAVMPKKKRGSIVRERSGRAGRKTMYEKRQEDVRLAGYEARQRVFLLPGSLASLEEAESAVGRLCLRNKLDPDDELRNAAMFEAYKRFEVLCRDYDVMMLVKPRLSASNLDRQGGYDASDGTDPDYVARFLSVRARYLGCWRVLREADPLAAQAVMLWLDGQEAWEVLGELKLGLNALVKFFGVPVDKSAISCVNHQAT